MATRRPGNRGESSELGARKRVARRKKGYGSHTVVVDVSWIERFSSLSTLQRVVTFCLRFANNTRRIQVPRRRLLSVQELESALAVLIGLVQQQEFPQEIQSIRSHRAVPQKSRLLTEPIL